MLPSVFVSLQSLLSSHPRPFHPQAGQSPGGRMSPNPRMLGGSLPTPPPLRPPNTGIAKLLAFCRLMEISPCYPYVWGAGYKIRLTLCKKKKRNQGERRVEPGCIYFFHPLLPQRPHLQVANHKWTPKPLQMRHRFETQAKCSGIF